MRKKQNEVAMGERVLPGWGMVQQTSLRKTTRKHSQVGQESERNFIFNTMSQFGDNKLPIRMQTGMVRAGGTESLEDCIKLDTHKTK